MILLKSYVCGSDTSCGFGDYDEYISTAQGVLSTGMQDVTTAWYVILTSFLIACVLGFLYLFFMEKCATCIVWCALLIVNIMTIAFTGHLLQY